MLRLLNYWVPSVFIKLCLYINYFISFAGIPEKDIITNQLSRHFWNTSLVEQYLVFSHSWEATELLLIINRLEKIPLCVTASHFSPCQHFHLTFFHMRIISGREETAFNANIQRHSQMPPTPLLMTITWRHLSPFRAISKMYRNSQIGSAFSEILEFINQNHKGVCKVGVIKKFLYIWKWHGMGNFKVSFIVNMWLAGIGMKNYDENVFIVLVKCLLAGFIHIYLDR